MQYQNSAFFYHDGIIVSMSTKHVMSVRFTQNARTDLLFIQDRISEGLPFTTSQNETIAAALRYVAQGIRDEEIDPMDVIYQGE